MAGWILGALKSFDIDSGRHAWVLRLRCLAFESECLQHRRVFALTNMAEIHSAPMQQAALPLQIPQRTAALQIPPPSAVTLPSPSSASRIRTSHLALDTFSPVNQNGSFEFDRVLKSGYVQKRTRKTKVGPRDSTQWRNIPLT